MEQAKDLESMIGQMNYPAFLVRDEVITAVNTAAAQRMAENGMSIPDILVTGKEEYAQFQNGSLYLTLSLGGTEYACTVTKLQEQQLFTIEEETAQAELQVLALAAEQLCMPLSEITFILDRISGTSETDKARINQSLFRLQRIIGNMSDAAQLVNAAPKMVTHEVCALFAEILEKAKTLLDHTGIAVAYHLPSQPVYSLADPELLNRAVYNLLSNAAKFTAAGSTVEVTLKHIGSKLYLTVSDGGEGIKNTMRGSMFTRYTRQPGLEDRRYGLGLGMTLIHAAAAAHGGTVLVEQPEGQGAKITMTLSIRKSKDTNVRTPVLKPDIYGGRDQALIELSDVLPYHLYNDKKY